MRRSTILFSIFTLGVASILPSPIAAQDSRTVLEPFFPPTCASLDAQIQSTDSTLALAQEQASDTARVQRAIDRCGKGRALVLRVNQEKNAFVTGPLILRPDITLIVSRGVTLFAASEPRQFDLSPGSCGVVNGVASGCKPFISVDHATGDGIMGDGVIDGRGVVARLVNVDNSNSFTLYRITLRNSAGLTLTFDHGSGLTLWGVHVKAADNSTGKMGGIAIGSSARNVATTRSYVDSGAGQTEIVLTAAQQPAP